MSVTKAEAKKILVANSIQFTVDEEGMLSDADSKLASRLNDKLAKTYKRISWGRVWEDEEGREKFRVMTQYLVSEKEEIKARVKEAWRSGRDDCEAREDFLRPNKSQSSASREAAIADGVVITHSF